MGASIGVVQIRAETENVASLMSAADIACYAAKDAGRNRIHVYEADGVSDRHREMHWVARVTRAVEDKRLELFFQPIVALGSTRASAHFHELHGAPARRRRRSWCRRASSFRRPSATTSCR